jgi:glycosyltransferase involved in cell wall biosynthesis
MELSEVGQVIALLAVIVGAIGLLGMTWGFPLLALLLHRNPDAARKQQDELDSRDSTSSLTIVIPAHNEAQSIAGTIESILLAVDHLSASSNKSGTEQSTLTVEVLVIANCCSDSTVEVCRAFPSVKVEEYNDHASKWEALKFGCAHARGDWIIFADAGIRWPEDLLSELRKYINRPAVIGIAPSYYNSTAGLLERISWLLERHLKTVEGLSGGPISVHGATMMYRTTALRRAFEYLGPKGWLNDDVVIPLALRSIFPDKSIVYVTEIQVSDSSRDTEHAKRHRRVRLVQGNLDWISSSFWRSARDTSSLLAWRRIFRVGWAFWILCFLIPILTQGWLGMVLFTALLACLCFNHAFRASLMFPWIVLSRRGVVWK